MPEHGALVISLDFELHWGWLEGVRPGDPYYANFENVWQAVPALLALFETYKIPVTWATVGFLFSGSKAERDLFAPRDKPTYQQKALDPYAESIGNSEADDPYHFAPSLIAQIANTPRQEIGTHTYSHYYCEEPGQTVAQFRADLQSAVAIAKHYGISPTSIIFPRNQDSPEYLEVLREFDIKVSRGRPSTEFFNRIGLRRLKSLRFTRFSRLLDSLMMQFGWHLTAWDDVYRPEFDLYDIPSTFFLRPVPSRFSGVDAVRLFLIKRALTKAAKSGKIVHVWWHPHNFGASLSENIAFLTAILEHTKHLTAAYNFQPMSMRDVYQTLAE